MPAYVWFTHMHRCLQGLKWDKTFDKHFYMHIANQLLLWFVAGEIDQCLYQKNVQNVFVTFTKMWKILPKNDLQFWKFVANQIWYQFVFIPV